MKILPLNIKVYLERERNVTSQRQPSSVLSQEGHDKLKSVIESFSSRTPPNLSNEEIEHLVNTEYKLNDIIEGVLIEKNEEPLNEWVIDDSKTFKSNVENPPPEINFLLKKSIVENLVK